MGQAWRLSLSVPRAALPLFEAALEGFGGAVVTGGADAEGRVPIDVYLTGEPDRAALAARLGAAAAASGEAPPAVDCRPLPNLDWVAESHKALPPMRVGRFWVHGSHVLAPAPAGTLPLRIDATTAFGTGRHESTQGCLLALQGLARRLRPRRALDMGCGSGILAIAIAGLWPIRVTAVDNDAQSLVSTRVHAAMNRVDDRLRVVLSDGYRDRSVARGGPYDLIVANILARPLAAMATDLRRHLSPGGRAVLAGLLVPQERQVLARHRSLGLALSGRIVLGDWVTLVLRRRVH